jgi:hypothetical protein
MRLNVTIIESHGMSISLYGYLDPAARCPSAVWRGVRSASHWHCPHWHCSRATTPGYSAGSWYKLVRWTKTGRGPGGPVGPDRDFVKLIIVGFSKSVCAYQPGVMRGIRRESFIVYATRNAPRPISRSCSYYRIVCRQMKNQIKHGENECTVKWLID